uniref:Uncharacterized protein n=1 Tax=Rhizophora mucronata TaxID=61149 RepID=A0A2P2NA23_RHIMU
MTLYSQRQAV